MLQTGLTQANIPWSLADILWYVRIDVPEASKLWCDYLW